MFINSIYILLFSLSIIYSYPCPPECICKPTDTDDVDFIRMSYVITCSNAAFKNEQLIHEAQQWSINEDKPYDLDDDGSTPNYVIAIDLSNSLSLKKFTNKTIQLTNFSYTIRGLSLANQGNKFTLGSNSFYSPIYENLRILNLSSCCKQIPDQCPQIFRPLKALRLLDLSGSDMYKACLNTPDTISSKLHDLILRNNIYDTNTFSHSCNLFNSVRSITGTLDLQNSRFKSSTKANENCLFDLFQQITTLDLSSIKFESESNNNENLLTHLLQCKTKSNDSIPGSQLLNLYLRHLNIETLPEWLTDKRFLLLKRLDLSNNNIFYIDINIFENLQHLSLAYNPIELFNITWRDKKFYESINLCSTIRNRTFNLSKRLKNLFRLTKNVDYSENEGVLPVNITRIPLGVDFNTLDFSLNISRTNLYSFVVDFYDIHRLDVSFNHLTELNLDKQMKLNYIDCSHQNLSKLILNKQLLELEELRCSNNSLKTVENLVFMEYTKLKLVDLSYNKIDSLKNLFHYLTSRFLHTINLKSNLIQIVPSYIFDNKLISLYEINLSYNRIHTIQTDAFESPNLQILDLTGNPLKTIEPNAIFTASLRLFYVYDDSQKPANQSANSKSLDQFLLLHKKWYKQNGTFMKNNPMRFRETSPLDKHKQESGLINKGTKHFLKSYILYGTLGVVLLCVLFGGIYYYRKHQIIYFPSFQHYRKIDRQQLVQNATEMDIDQREEDEIVMNLEEPPFNLRNQAPKNG
ncbi:unnamed protein product [Rotaria socialis]|uniref:Uncharacterized protein n=1 Tax=Rotaria socialis TaxID=392032 RepID=A0A818Q6T0_9BILA|nr:unnamed protein product [Rotaria socialis]CAF4269796.1 unnamed protein product [Rotaria socialis]